MELSLCICSVSLNHQPVVKINLVLALPKLIYYAVYLSYVETRDLMAAKRAIFSQKLKGCLDQLG